MKRIHIAVACVAAMLMLPGFRPAGFMPDEVNPAIVLAENDGMNARAERYVKLVLAMGQHDADYVDAFYGPPEWRKEAEAAKRPLAAIDADAGAILKELAAAPPAASADEMTRLRHQYLMKQLQALRARVGMLQGKKLTFDEEAKALYDAAPPTRAEAEFQKTLAELEKRLPGDGPLIDRYDAFRKRFVVPKERLDEVFRAAIEGCRQRTLRHIELPRRIRHRQELERLQLVSRELPQHHPGEHRPADLYRSRDRPGVPRRVSGASCLQRAAGKEPRA
jgi:hypothetical protein